MALVIDPATKVITVPQADLSFVSGTLWVLDSDAFRQNVMDDLSAQEHIWMEDAFIHNGEVTVAGTTFARTLEFINGYSISLEDTGSAYTVQIEGSNNNIFDIENGIMNPTPLVTVISTNSAGLILAPSQATQEQQIKEMWQIRGLDPTFPVTFTPDKIFVDDEPTPELEIILTGDGTTIKVATRTP
jgi:hypothetical protein